MALDSFFTYALSADGLAAIAGWLLANLLEPLPWWQELPALRKRYYVMALTILILPALLLLLGSLLLLVVVDQETVFLALQAGFVAYAASQASHGRQLAQPQAQKAAGAALLTAYRDCLGPGAALTADTGVRFAHRAQQIAQAALDNRARK